MLQFLTRRFGAQQFARHLSKNVLISPVVDPNTPRVYQEGIFQHMTSDVQSALSALKITNPSEIQQLVIPHILKGNNVVFCSQTGSGKTLAYVLPILQKTKQGEESQQERVKSRPKVLILVPTKELVTQVVKTIKSVTYHVKLSSVGLRSDQKMRVIKKYLDNHVDIVVTTPGIFSKCYDNKLIFMSQLHTVIIDEADTMLSKGFDKQVIDRVIHPAQNIEKTRERDVQFIFCLATFEKNLKNYLSKDFPNIKMITSENLHKTVPKVKHEFIQVHGGDKFEKLSELCKDSKERVIVFCNTIKSCQACDHYLNEKGISCANYQSEMPPQLKKREFERFVSGDTNILVTTDIASRGLDFKDVKLVIMVDFPENTIEYLHRSGRTGRMGAKGRVISLLNKKDQVLASEIEKAIKSGQKLEGLSPDRTVNDKIYQDREEAKLAKRSSVVGKRKLWMKSKFDKMVKSKHVKPTMKPSSSKVKDLLKMKK